MLAQQHFVDPAARKRLREEEEDMIAGAGCGFAEHRNKRLHLPVRTSPTSQKHAMPHTLAGGQPDNGDTARAWMSSPTFGSGNAYQVDGDMDMGMDVVIPSLHSAEPGRNGCPLEPTRLNSVTDSSAGRMPTPILPSFATQVRDSGSWSGPGPAVTSQSGIVNMGHVHGSYQDRAVPRTMQQNDAWPAAIHHRIPSPISEGDCGSPAMYIDEDHHTEGHVQDHLCATRLSSELQRSTLSTHGEDAGMMDVSQQQPHSPIGLHPEAADGMHGLTETTSAPTTPSPGRSRGHMRSHHTINTWTWQPGMKRSFSIGYRADCEKCRLKVPGHFNHIVVQ